MGMDYYDNELEAYVDTFAFKGMNGNRLSISQSAVIRALDDSDLSDMILGHFEREFKLTKLSKEINALITSIAGAGASLKMWGQAEELVLPSIIRS